MAVKNCRICNTIFDGESAICTKCDRSNGNQFNLVRSYLYDNPGSTVLEVEAATGVSRRIINEYLNEGKVSYVNSVNTHTNCRMCGRRIMQGVECLCTKNAINKRR